MTYNVFGGTLNPTLLLVRNDQLYMELFTSVTPKTNNCIFRRNIWIFTELCLHVYLVLITSTISLLFYSDCQGSENGSKIFVCTSRSQLFAKSDLCNTLKVIDVKVNCILYVEMCVC